MICINIFDKNEKRRNNLTKTFQEIGIENIKVKEYENIWGEKVNKFSIWSKNICDTKCIKSSDITFIHSNNDFSDKYVEYLCSDKIVVIYSGGNLKDFHSRNIRHFYYTNAVGDDANPGWNLKAFVEAVINKEENIFEKLVGFDIQLETRLDFLYQCLSKDEIRSSYDFKANNSDLKIEEIESKQDELRQMIGNSEKNNEYIHKLTDLRNELIPAKIETDN